MVVGERAVESADGVSELVLGKGEGSDGHAFVVLVVCAYAVGSDSNQPSLLVAFDEAYLAPGNR